MREKYYQRRHKAARGMKYKRRPKGKATVRPGRLASEMVHGSGKGGRVARPAMALSRAPVGTALGGARECERKRERRREMGESLAEERERNAESLLSPSVQTKKKK
jgi:hypothetical protein